MWKQWPKVRKGVWFKCRSAKVFQSGNLMCKSYNIKQKQKKKEIGAGNCEKRKES